MIHFLILVFGIVIGATLMYILCNPKKVGTLLFHDPQSMYAELDCPVEEVYKRSRVIFTISRR